MDGPLPFSSDSPEGDADEEPDEEGARGPASSSPSASEEEGDDAAKSSPPDGMGESGEPVFLEDGEIAGVLGHEVEFGHEGFPDHFDFDMDPGASFPDDAVDLPLRGWVPPDDRLWLHPSELARLSGGRGDAPSHRSRASAGGQGPYGPGARQAGHGLASRYSPRGHPLVTLGVVAIAVVSTVVAGLALTDVPAPGGGTASFVATDTSVYSPVSAGPRFATTASSLPVGANVVRLAQAVRSSLVEVVLVRGSDPTIATGVALPGGRLVMVPAATLAGVQRAFVLGANGNKEQAAVLGADPRSGVGVVGIPVPMSSPRLADNHLNPGELAVSVCLAAASSSIKPSKSKRSKVPPVTPVVSVGMVHSVTTPLDASGAPELIDTIVADAPTPGCAFGGVLLGASGGVEGVLAWQEREGDDVIDYFTPSALAVGVASELAFRHRIVHGWLGVVGVGATGGKGALIEQVLPGSSAARAGLQPGDLIESVNGAPVHSMAGLQARLYLMPPGSEVQLVVDAGGSTRQVDATLASAPT